MFLTSKETRRQAFVLVIAHVALGLWCAVAHGGVAAVHDVPDPTQPELLEAAGVAPDDPPGLFGRLVSLTLHDPGAADAWLSFLREGEHAKLLAELQKHGLGARLGKGGEWQEMLPKLQKELAAQRLGCPARQIDAILRQLETVGTLEQIEPLLSLARYRSRTPWGRWKFYATVQGILSRHEIDRLVKAELVPISELAPLLRDLEPRKGGALAVEMLNRMDRSRARQAGGYGMWEVATRFWLAWAAGSVEPERAFAVFKEGLVCPDPAWRLFSGMGIIRITGSLPPFRLTAPPAETAEARLKWLASLKVRPADPWQHIDPLAFPVVKERRNMRRDLWWLAEDGSVSRSQDDVWPAVRFALPDGSLYSRYRGRGLALTGPGGEVHARFPEVDYNGLTAAHGGLWALRRDTTEAVEYAPTGDVLWACPTSQTNAGARMVAGAGPGRVLLLRYGKVEILNRRGDVLRSVTGKFDDPRFVIMPEPKRLLISCTNELVVYDLDDGEQERIGGFKSLVGVRYHPRRPWVLFDGGAWTVILYDPVKKTKISTSTGWTNSGRPPKSKWADERR